MCSACERDYKDRRYEEWDAEAAFNESERAKAEAEEEPICPECEHPMRLHENKYGCDYEADRYEPDIGPVAWRCGCKAKGEVA